MLTTLLAESNPRLANQLSQAISTANVPRPQHVTTGQDALAWATNVPYDLCFVADRLPDMSGVELIIRLRQRQGDLPIVMVSGAKSEAVAVAALRAGVTDYLPTDRELRETVTRTVQRFATVEHAAIDHPVTPPLPAGGPATLLQPTYQNRLRAIGRQLDVQRVRMASILEVDAGFLVRAFPHDGRTPDAFEVPNRDVLFWISDAFRARGAGERGPSTSPLLPSGYEDFLRAIGQALDQHPAEAIAVAEYAQMIIVTGLTKLDTAMQTSLGGVEWILRADEIQQVLDQSFRRRQAGDRSSGTGRSLFRRLSRE